jgi:hypothetical protein
MEPEDVPECDDLFGFPEPEEEPRELAYRRGYRAGWIHAHNQVRDLMFKHGHTREEAVAKLFAHWHNELLRWKHRGEDGKFEVPPPVDSS